MTRFAMSDTISFSQTLARLMRALDAASEAELARALGITPQSVSGARKRGEVPPAWIQTCAAQTGVNAHWLFFGSGPMRLPEAAEGELPSMQEDCDTELITVPLAEARLSAGTGSLEVSSNSNEGGYAFRSDFLRRKGNPRRMVLMRVSGDSMVPEIFDNDLVLLDRGQTEISPGRLYAVGFEDAIYIKRIDKLPGKIILHSVNPAYPPLSLDLPGLSAACSGPVVNTADPRALTDFRRPRPTVMAEAGNHARRGVGSNRAVIGIRHHLRPFLVSARLNISKNCGRGRAQRSCPC